MKQKERKTNKLEGIISISAKGTGYVAIEGLKEKGQDPEIDYKHLNTALHGDVVEIILHPKKFGRQTAEVSKIISRAKTRFTGVLENENKLSFLKPDDTKMYTDILIPKEYFRKYGKLDNLWKYNLPNAWRLIYTIKTEEVVVLSVILEWMDHKNYERRFKY